MAVVDKIDPYNDSRVVHRTANVNGRVYKYLDARPPDGIVKGAIVLIHGFPDISMGWRYQIPLLLKLRLHVICPDMMGYGGTAAPRVPPADISLYSIRTAADDIKELARLSGFSKFMLGGHDWGGAIVYRVAQYYPDVVTHLFAVCTAFNPTTKNFVSLERVVERAPQFGYQIHFAGSAVEGFLNSRERIRHFLNGMYGARTADRRSALSPRHGVDFDAIESIGKTELLSDREMDYYLEQFARNGIHGPLNWYRTREVNYEDERWINPSSIIDVPVLFIQANRDAILSPVLSKRMDRYITNLTRKEVSTAHWALWEAPAEVNKHLEEWIEGTVFGGAKGKL